MTTHFESSSLGRSARAPSMIVAVARYARTVQAALLSWNNRRVLSRTISTMDDRMLSDIGLTRSDVYAALSEPLWRDPTARLGSLAEDRRDAALQLRRERVQRRPAGGGAPLKLIAPQPPRSTFRQEAQACCNAAA